MLNLLQKENIKLNTLVVYTMNGTSEVIDSVKNYKLAENTEWLAFQSGKKDSTLHVRSVDGKLSFSIPSVTSYGFAKEGSALYYVQKNECNNLYVMLPETRNATLIKGGKGDFTKITFDEKGDYLAFLYSDDKKTAYKTSELWLSAKGNAAIQVATKGNSAFPKDWVVNDTTGCG